MVVDWERLEQELANRGPSAGLPAGLPRFSRPELLLGRPLPMAMWPGVLRSWVERHIRRW